ncbi:MAG: hypothetical protein AAFR04_05300 [Pseudomonadota bacterium]
MERKALFIALSLTGTLMAAGSAQAGMAGWHGVAAASQGDAAPIVNVAGRKRRFGGFGKRGFRKMRRPRNGITAWAAGQRRKAWKKHIKPLSTRPRRPANVHKFIKSPTMNRQRGCRRVGHFGQYRCNF